MSGVVIVDQADPQLVVTAGKPDLFGGPLEYQGTVRGSEAGGAWTFAWTGGDIQLYGSVLYDGRGNASYSLDSQSPKSYVAPIEDLNRRSHYKFFETNGLADGKHSITATQGLADIRATMYYDYILYKVGAGTTVTKDMSYFVDDADMAISGTGWSQNQGRFNAFKETLTTASEGSSFSYKFYGTGISVHGAYSAITENAYQATFSIDGGATISYNEPKPNPEDKFWEYNHQFLNIENLEQGKEHTLTFTANTPGLNIDYLLISPGAGGSRTTDAALGATSGSSGASPSGTGTPGNLGSSASKSTPVGAIAGGVAAGVVALLAALFFFLWYRKRNRKPRGMTIDGEGKGGLGMAQPTWAAPPVTPFALTANTHNTSTESVYTSSNRPQSTWGGTQSTPLQSDGRLSTSVPPGAPSESAYSGPSIQPSSQSSRPWNGAWPAEKGSRSNLSSSVPVNGADGRQGASGSGPVHAVAVRASGPRVTQVEDQRGDTPPAYS